jgi:hypothetical protein
MLEAEIEKRTINPNYQAFGLSDPSNGVAGRLITRCVHTELQVSFIYGDPGVASGVDLSVVAHFYVSQ